MDKFWSSVAVLLFVGIFFVVQPLGSSEIDFRDLETECRYDMAEEAEINLKDGILVFEGNFPVDNPDSELSYRYSNRLNKIVLDVRESGVEQPETFMDDCLGSAVYHARTDELPEGRYKVVVRHDGSTFKKQFIDIR